MVVLLYGIVIFINFQYILKNITYPYVQNIYIYNNISLGNKFGILKRTTLTPVFAEPVIYCILFQYKTIILIYKVELQ